MKTRTETIINVADWNNLVTSTYDRPYNFQQQNGGQERGLVQFTVPGEAYDDEMNQTVPEVTNCEAEEVKFELWKTRDPKEPLRGDNTSSNPPRYDQFHIKLWWDRNFYPELQTVANDLHSKGLLPAGTYSIEID